MKTRSIISVRILTLFIFIVFATNSAVSQDNLFQNLSSNNDDSVVMTWNKDTPEQEMKDDIKALSEKGITIKYDDLKRNSKQEITAIKVSFEDRKGNKGNLSYNNVNPINTIVFSKNGDSVGFGEPTNSGFGFANNIGDMTEILKQFQMQSNQNNSKSFQFPGEGKKSGMSSIRQEIITDGKQPIVIENGKIIKGGDDYSKEQLEEILQKNKENTSVFDKSFDLNKEFDFRDENDLNAFKDKFGSTFGEENNATKAATEELKQAKVEMQKAKVALEKARKQLEEKQNTKKQ